jgi:chromosome segregation ATPase
MAKTTDALLRIRAKNLATKEIREVGKELDKLADTQKSSASANALAARSIEELQVEYANLRTIAKDLERRGGIANALKKDAAAIESTKARINELSAALNALATKKASGDKVKGIGEEIRKTTLKIEAANRVLGKQVERFEKSAAAAKTLGISADKIDDSINDINAELRRTATLTETAGASMEGYKAAVLQANTELKEQEARQRAINLEAQKRLAIEAQINRKRFELNAALQTSAQAEKIAR